MVHNRASMLIKTAHFVNQRFQVVLNVNCKSVAREPKLSLEPDVELVK